MSFKLSLLLQTTSLSPIGASYFRYWYQLGVRLGSLKLFKFLTLQKPKLRLTMKTEAVIYSEEWFRSLSSIIHNANLSRSRNAGEFADDTRRNLQKAADEFKLLQQQRLQQQINAPASPGSDPISGSNTP